MKMLFSPRSIFLIMALALFTVPTNGQFLKKLGKRAQKAAERTVERRVDQEASKKTDQTLDSILEPGKKGKQAPPKTDSPQSPDNGGSNPSSNEPNPNGGNGQSPTSAGTKSIEVYSKFDYVPGDKQLFFDDFTNDFIGDFPAKWNTDGGGEVVSIEDTKWLEMKMSSFYVPDVGELPENYTIEFDIRTKGLDKNTSSVAKLHLILDESTGFGYGKNALYAYLPFCQYSSQGVRIWAQEDGKRLLDNRVTSDIRPEMASEPHISVAVNKERFRLWVNERKILDVPRAVADGKITALKFEPVGFKDGKERLFISNLKVAEGGLDLRRKLISEGKISTNGILFDSGSANLKPESMGIIRQIYQVLQQDSNINLKIIGHTDSDGGDEANLKLSKSRADAVKDALVRVYGVDNSRLNTEGKGELEPVAENTSPEGKAQNRRVEFIKQ